MIHTIEKELLPIQQQPLREARFIIAHEAGNPNNTGSNSLVNEVTYMKRNWQNAFVSHWVGSGGRIIQTAQTGRIQWGAGPQANPYAYAQVELARTNRYSLFEKDYAAYVWLLRQLARDARLPMTLNAGQSSQSPGIKTHSWVSRFLGGTDHVDPDGYLASWGVGMARFKEDIERPVASLREVSPQPSSGKYQLHLVSRGDTLWDLARRYGTTVARLKEWNQLRTDLILVGQILKVKPF